MRRKQIGLILEGTYPYITGGVSSCVHQMIKGMPEIDFHIIYLADTLKKSLKEKYPLPENLKSIKKIGLYDTRDFTQCDILKKEKVIYSDLAAILSSISENKIDFAMLEKVCDYFPENYSSLLVSRDFWNLMIELLKESKEDISFIDFYYSIRYMLAPILNLIQNDFPQVDIYHSLCTGYAGFLGAYLKYKYSSNFILTEHGIYTHERELEISSASWIYDRDGLDKPFFKSLWIDFFKFLSQVSYDSAVEITTLFSENAKKQISLGADSSKITIIPNGIKQPPTKKANKNTLRTKISLVGRVVPIKDIKTFIKSIFGVHKVHKNLEVDILGPIDEDKNYYEQCLKLVDMLGLEDVIKFRGKVDLSEYYPHIDIIVLSSVSEGQPLVILEAFANKIPAISTDVGACSELIYGQTHGGDDSLKAGEIVNLGDYIGLEKAICKLLEDSEKRREMGEIGFQRFKKYYLEEKMIQNYNHLYERWQE